MRKKMMRGMLTACILLLGIAVQAQTSSNPVGKWDYSCPDAPYEYSTGKAEFKQQDGKLMLVMTVNQVQGQPVVVTKKNDEYSCRFSFDNDAYAIVVTLKPDGDNLKGFVSSDQWDIPITMKPEKK